VAEGVAAEEEVAAAAAEEEEEEEVAAAAEEEEEEEVAAAAVATGGFILAFLRFGSGNSAAPLVEAATRAAGHWETGATWPNSSRYLLSVAAYRIPWPAVSSPPSGLWSMIAPQRSMHNE